MPSCRNFRKLDQYSSRHRCAMRGRQSKDNVRNLPEAKIAPSRSTRQQNSFIIEFRRWLVEFWNSVIKRLKGVFSNSRNLHSSRSLTSRLSNIELDRENAFWREGGVCHNYEKNYPMNVRRKNSNANSSKQNREAYSQSNNRRHLHVQTSPAYPVGYKTYQWPKTRRSSTRELANFDATETTDDEYYALYKKSSRSEDIGKSERILGNSSGDCIVEPIEAILSRYQTGKSSKSTIYRKFDSSIDDINVSDEGKSMQKPKASRSVTDQNRISMESTGSGKWIETNYFGSVWYSKSELNITPKRTNTTRTRNQVSRIPRLRHTPTKTDKIGKRYHTKNASQPNSVRK